MNEEHRDSVLTCGRIDLRRGFSLIEVLIVITLMGILVGIVLPRFETSIPSHLQNTAQVVADDLAYVRNLAVSNNSSYQLTFDLKNNRYTIQHTGSNPALATLPPSPFDQAADQPTQRVTDLDDLLRTGPTTKIVAVQKLFDSSATESVGNLQFDSLGATSRAERTIIWLSCGVGDARRYVPIHINPVTGLASIGELQTSLPVKKVPVRFPIAEPIYVIEEPSVIYIDEPMYEEDVADDGFVEPTE